MKKNVSKLIIILLSIFMCLPIILIVSGSLMGLDELKECLGPALSDMEGYVRLSLFPKYPTFKSIVQLLLDTPEFFVMYWNSIKIVVFVLFGQVLLAMPAAWAFAQYNFSYKKLLFTIYIVVMLMPFQVTMLSSYIVLDKFNIINTHLSLIIPGIFSTFPVFIMYRFFSNIPKSILEAARIDGASEIKVFLNIGVPLGMPGIISAMVLGFIEYWNLIEQPLTFIKDQSLWPISLYLPNIGLENADIAFLASLVTLLTSLAVFFAGQKYLKEGISATSGGEK
ncbi:carbohydrate ABC transporter permease [Paraclostridium ghonii]|uniref:carbohydrate ABC transporter permease n=1 Tax=Paraclostridium ghonii TaxID=29358 RepID=UPI00202D0CAB|nr:carbohydrate ABC transporter permease [Paeniclostridium ghonii]MCM0166931.1 carbohydrate ABC transporter permease [Paeniclostridium ghonii]